MGRYARRWTAGEFDSLIVIILTDFLQMAALSVIGATLNRQDLAPLSLNTGATSKSDPTAGINAPYNPLDEHGPVTTGEKVGAAFATLAVAAVIIGGAIWIVL